MTSQPTFLTSDEKHALTENLPEFFKDNGPLSIALLHKATHDMNKDHVDAPYYVELTNKLIDTAIGEKKYMYASHAFSLLDMQRDLIEDRDLLQGNIIKIIDAEITQAEFAASSTSQPLTPKDKAGYRLQRAYTSVSYYNLLDYVSDDLANSKKEEIFDTLISIGTVDTVQACDELLHDKYIRLCEDFLLNNSSVTEISEHAHDIGAKAEKLVSVLTANGIDENAPFYAFGLNGLSGIKHGMHDGMKAILGEYKEELKL